MSFDGANRRSIEHMYDIRGRCRQKHAFVEQNFEWACRALRLQGKFTRRAGQPNADYGRDMASIRKNVVAAWKHASAEQAPLLAAGVAFYVFLSLFPTMIATVMIYGLVASPESVQRQSSKIAQALPVRCRIGHQRPAHIADLDLTELPRHRTGHRPRARPVRRIRWRRQPGHRDQPDVRSSRSSQLRQEEGAGADADSRRDRVLHHHGCPRGRRSSRAPLHLARGAAVDRRRRLDRRGDRHTVSGRARPPRRSRTVHRQGRRRREPALDRRVSGLLVVRRELRQLRQDVRSARRRGRAAALALDRHVRTAARRRSQGDRRGRPATAGRTKAEERPHLVRFRYSRCALHLKEWG